MNLQRIRSSGSVQDMNPSNKNGTWKVAAVQVKFASEIEGNLEKTLEVFRALRRSKPDVVLFPECMLTGYRYDFSKLGGGEIRIALRQVAEWAKEFDMNVIIGTPAIRNGRLQNCAVAFDRRGRLVHCYAKCQLTEADKKVFTPGNHIALFKLDGICCSTIICHERRYPELVRLAAMAGAQVLFHPNAGLDSLAVSKAKRDGLDGIAVRAFENAIYYVFANSVGPQGAGKWSAGDAKIVAPSGRVLKLAGNQEEETIVSNIDLSLATRKYARDSFDSPQFLQDSWRRLVVEVKERAKSEGGLQLD
jgi:predicted amidohydrolase